MKDIMHIPRIKNLEEFGILLMIIKTFLDSSIAVPCTDLADAFLTFTVCSVFLLAIFSQGYKKDKLFLCGLLLLAAGYSCIKIGNSSLLITILTCLAIRRQDIDKTINFIFRYTVVLFILHFLLALTSHILFGSEIWTIYQGKKVLHLGFGHRNRLSIMVFNLMILWIYLNFYKIRKRGYLLLTIIGLFTFWVTRTKTFLIEVIMAVVLLKLINMKKKRINRAINSLASILFIVLFLFTNILVAHYLDGYRLVSMINTMLTNRIRLGGYALYNYGITLFGQKINYIAVWDELFGLTTFTFDNIYSFLAINQGIIWALIIAICLWKLAVLRDIRINYCIVLWCLYGLTEVHGLNCYMFFPLILIVNLLKNERWKYFKVSVKSNED